MELYHPLLADDMDWMEVCNAGTGKRKQLSPELCPCYEAESDWRLES